MEHQNKLIYGGLLAISALTGCTEPVTEKPLNIVYIMTDDHIWGIERSGFFNGREKWAKGFENQRV